MATVAAVTAVQDEPTRRLKAVEQFIQTLTARLDELVETVDLNGSDHEERLDRLECAPVEAVIERRKLALELANSFNGTPEDVVARAMAYLAFLEGRDP